MSLVEKALQRMTQARAQAKAQESPVPAPAPAAASQTPPNPLRPRRELDFAALRAGGLLAAEHERKLFSQVFRGIKRPILNAIAASEQGSLDQARSNVVMVASSMSGDGKTFTATNLALSLALERDKQVVLVDGDVVKRELSQRFGFIDEPGLINALEDSTLPVDQFVIQTDLPNLSVLPAGHTSLHATELLSSVRMSELLQHLAAGPDTLVIFDSPPLLLTSESRIIAELSGQAVLVVSSGKTSKDMLDRALRVLRACPSISLVLNQSLSPPNSGYGYGYGYGYGEKPDTRK